MLGEGRGRRGPARAREIALHASLLACCVWGIVAADVVSPGPFGRYSQFRKGNDFVQFYVAGALAREGRFDALADPVEFRKAQRPYFRADDQAGFPPVYGPQVGLFFAPLTLVPYLWAYGLWSAFTLAAVVWTVAICQRMSQPLAAWRTAVLAATLAYPPLGYLVLNGQLSALAATALGLSLIAFHAGSKALAGAAIGLLGYKVSLFVPAVTVCLLAGEWVVAAGAVLVAALEVGVAAPVVGVGVVGDIRRKHPRFRTLTRGARPQPLSHGLVAYLLVRIAAAGGCLGGLCGERQHHGCRGRMGLAPFVRASQPRRDAGPGHRTGGATLLLLRPRDSWAGVRGFRWNSGHTAGARVAMVQLAVLLRAVGGPPSGRIPRSSGDSAARSVADRTDPRGPRRQPDSRRADGSQTLFCWRPDKPVI